MKKETGKKKVLIVHNYYKIPGGEDTVVENEKRLLEINGHQVFLYSRRNKEMDRFSVFRKLLLPFTAVFNPKTYREIKTIIRRERIEIVHVHNTLNLVSPSVYYAAVRCGVPVVQTIHNFRMVCPAATFFRDGAICEACVTQGLGCAVKHGCYRNSKLQTLVSVITMKVHRITGIYHKINYICLTEFNKRKLLELNNAQKKEIFDPRKMYVKPNMVFRTELQPSSKKEDFYLFAGRVEKIKGVDILIRAFEILPEEKLLIAGTGSELEDYRKLISEKQIENIKFLGFQKKDQLQPLIRKAKAVILPSQWYEGFPMTILEAFSMGTPVIGSNIGNVGDQIQEGVNGWKFVYDSPEDLAEKIRQCSRTPGERLHVTCEETLLPEGNYQELIRIYDSAKC